MNCDFQAKKSSHIFAVNVPKKIRVKKEKLSLLGDINSSRLLPFARLVAIIVIEPASGSVAASGPVTLARRRYTTIINIHHWVCFSANKKKPEEEEEMESMSEMPVDRQFEFLNCGDLRKMMLRFGSLRDITTNTLLGTSSRNIAKNLETKFIETEVVKFANTFSFSTLLNTFFVTTTSLCHFSTRLNTYIELPYVFISVFYFVLLVSLSDSG